MHLHLAAAWTNVSIPRRTKSCMLGCCYFSLPSLEIRTEEIAASCGMKVARAVSCLRSQTDEAGAAAPSHSLC